MGALPADAEVVVIGAGAVGCSVAAALADAGRTDVLVVEGRPDVSLGTTAMGAGMFGALRPDLERVQRDVEGRAIFEELERSEEVTPGWEVVGSIRLACTEEGAEGLRGLAEIARAAGVPAELVGPRDVAGAWPMLDVSRVQLALHVPGDAQMRPHRVAASFLHRAQRQGVAFEPGTRVTGLLTEADGRVRGVQTGRGRVRSGWVVNAAGPGAAGVARMAGLDLPIVPVRHCYHVTPALAAVPRPLPHLRFTEEGLYARTRDGGVLIGGWEPPGQGRALDPREVPAGELVDPPDIAWDTHDAFDSALARYLPDLRHWSRQAFARGWPTFTPDAQHVVGESGAAPGLVMAAGCNAHGIAGAPALGRLVADALAGRRDAYLDRLHPDRFRGGFSWENAIASARGHSETYNALTAQAA